MCGRSPFQPTEALYQRFTIANRLDALAARDNIAPGQLVPVMISQGANQLVLRRWGLIPHWAKEEQTADQMINARAETLAQRPAFRGLLAANRCLVPASGFFECRAEPRGKRPHYIHPTSHQCFAFAGLYDVWTRPDGEALHTFTIITTDADKCMAQLHHRMPVMLDQDVEGAWLDPEITSAGQTWPQPPLHPCGLQPTVSRPQVDDPWRKD